MIHDAFALEDLVYFQEHYIITLACECLFHVSISYYMEFHNVNIERREREMHKGGIVVIEKYIHRKSIGESLKIIMI